jgi:hypothetical protein
MGCEGARRPSAGPSFGGMVVVEQVCERLLELGVAPEQGGVQVHGSSLISRLSRRREKDRFWGNKWGNMPHRFQPIST